MAVAEPIQAQTCPVQLPFRKTDGYMMDVVRSINEANMEKAEVKSSQEIGTLLANPVSSRTTIKIVTTKHMIHVTILQAPYWVWYIWTLATKLKAVQEKKIWRKRRISKGLKNERRSILRL